MRIFDGLNLAFKAAVTLPRFRVPGTDGGTVRIPSKGAYVFTDDSGTVFHALFKADTEEELDRGWALKSYDVRALTTPLPPS